MSKRIDPKLPIAPVAGDDPAVPLMKPDRYMDRLVRRLNELFREFSGTISLEDEGVYLGEVDTLNFVGGAVTATIDSNGIGVITITGTGSSTTAAATPLLTVLDEGVTQGAGADISQMNFVGTPVTATVTGGVATITVVGTSQQPLYVYFA